MKAVRLHGVGDLRVETIRDPGEPGPGHVCIEVVAAGICGSDIHNFRTGQWLTDAARVAGHELAGRVVAIGRGVETLRLGELVVGDSRMWCGSCPQCAAGRPHLCETLGFVGEVCDGGFAEMVVLPARLLHRVNPGVEPVVAALAEPLAVALHAISRLAAAPGEPVLVAGCGPIGGIAALLLSKQHGSKVLIADRNAARRSLVANVTGAAIVELDEASVAGALDGQLLCGAIEATGRICVLSQLLELMPGGGRIALVGIFHGELGLDPNRLVERELSLLGCHAFQDELPKAVTLLDEIAPALRRFVEAEITLDEVPSAYQRLASGQANGLKVVVRPDHSS